MKTSCCSSAVLTLVTPLLLQLAACGRIGYELEEIAEESASLVPAEGNVSDAAAAPDGGVAEPLGVSNLRVIWTTPHTIRWGWDLTGSDEQVDHLELVVGPSADDVLGVSQATHVWTQSENAELGGRRFSTVTFEHTPDAAYFAQLHVVGSNGEQLSTDVASAQTQPAANNSIVLFTEAETAGFSLPAELVYSSSGGNTEPACYQFTSQCDGAPSCWTNLRRSSVNIDTSQVDAALFASAYLEWSFAIDYPDAVTYASVMVRVGPAPGVFFLREGFAVKGGGEYHTYEIPLSELGDEGARLTQEQLITGLYEFGFGGSWADGSTVRVDDVYIRY